MMPDGLTFERAALRIERIMQVLAALGTAAAWPLGGWRWAAGFLLGAAISILNYRWLRSLVEALGGGRRRRGSVFLAFRYLLLGGGAYVILKLTSISPTAVLAGLFVLTAALFVEIIFEIFYGK